MSVLASALCLHGVACSGARDVDAGGDASSDAAAMGDGCPFELPDAGAIARPVWPPSPPWEPPFELSSEVGWRESTVPLCSPVVGRVSAARVWADSRGVFVLGSIVNNLLDPDSPHAPSGTVLMFNDGTGWRAWIDDLTWRYVELDAGIAGVEGGPPLLYGALACAIVAVAGPGDRSCFYTGDVSLGGQVLAAHADPERVWALHQLGLASYADGAWRAVTALTQPADPLGIRLDIWGDGDRFFILHNTELEEGSLAQGVTAHHFDDVEHSSFTAFWVRAPNDMWIGTLAGDLIHFDGSSAETVAGVGPGPVVALWGTDTELYFITRSAVGRVRAGAAELLLSHDRADLAIWEQTAFADISGNVSRGEVYVTLIDARHEAYECGAVFMLWYDGAIFRRF